MVDVQKPVLILGGAGQVGVRAAQALRQLQPALPIAIGARDLAQARVIAHEVGGARAARIDLSRGDLGLPAGEAYGAVAAILKDEALHALQFAQGRGVPYLSISSGLLDIGPEVSAAILRPGAAPVLLASHCLAGMAVLAALALARDLARVEAVRVALILDEQDMGGPAAMADFERLSAISTAGLVRDGGAFVWRSGDAGQTVVHSVDGTAMAGQAIATLDVPALAMATGAPDVRFDMALGETASRRRGEAFSTEVRIELDGEGKDGQPARRRCDLVHPDGQRPLTALGVALGIEALLGLGGGRPAAPGLYYPEALVDAAYAVRRLREFGAVIDVGEG